MIGVGSGAACVINHMIDSPLDDIDFIMTDTDAQVLASNKAPNRILLGKKDNAGRDTIITDVERRRVSKKNMDRIQGLLQGTDMVFIIAGLGGSTGTSVAPIIAKQAKNMGILTVAMVTMPLNSEGTKRKNIAENGLVELRNHVDTIIAIPSQNLVSTIDGNITTPDAFKQIDDMLYQSVRSITDLIIAPGLINIDFTDMKTLMENMGQSMIGTAEATGDTRAMDAATNAIACQLFDDVPIYSAKGILINITGGYNVALQEVDEAATLVRDMAHDDASIVFGAVLDESMEDSIRVTVVATGIS